MKKLEIKKLNIRQVIVVYRHSLKYEFPANERRPLFLIIKGVMSGTYECLGAFYKGRMVGYAFFLKHGNDYLWDYLAVLKKYRCKGVGSKIIQSIRLYYKTADSVIGEVENPTFAKDDKSAETMTRRLQFYMTNGCVDTKVRAKTFGVHFIIIQITGKALSAKNIEKLYRLHYKVSLPRNLYMGNIRTYR